MKLKLILTTAIVGAALALPGVSSAWAQAPPNDTFEQATVISSLPFSQILDTTQATTDSTDAEALAACGGPSFPVAATVWYEYTPPVDQSVLILTGPVPPSYPTGVAVVTGSPGSLSAVNCFPDLGSFLATAGVTYHIGVADISGGNGGELHFSVYDAGGRPQGRSLRPLRPKDGGRNAHRNAHMPERHHGHHFRGPVPAQHVRWHRPEPHRGRLQRRCPALVDRIHSP